MITLEIKNRGQLGNVLFLILIAVVLFGGLAYAVTYSMNSAPGKVEDEQQKLDQAVINNCEAAISLALLRLRNLGSCSEDEVNFELPDGSNKNPNAPVDGHCNVFHPQYGGASPCGLLVDPSCEFDNLSVGESCSGIVYAGEAGGHRVYTTRADHGKVGWNNGVYDPPWTITGATDWNDGMVNTDLLVALSDAGAPYQAANLCRSQGVDWYLPAINEVALYFANRAAIGGFDDSASYRSSTESSSMAAWRYRFSTSSAGTVSKNLAYNIRCAWRDQ